MYRKIFVLMMVIGLLAVSAAAVYAQGGRGRGNGGSGRGGNGGVTGGVCTDPGGCIPDPQAYNYGGQSSGGVQAGQGYGRQNQQGSRGMARNNAGTGIYSNLPPATVTELPPAVVDLMIDGWLDEQHAYAVYEAIMTQYGEIVPFVNIQQAEAQHAAAWEFLMQRYGITVPPVPEFSVPQFASVEAACAAAADAEVANFALYDNMLATFAPYPDLYQIAQALRDASEYQHLPAFQTCAG